MKQRTLASLPCLVGVHHDSWVRGSFVAHPIHGEWGLSSQNTRLMISCPKGKHIIHLSRNWAQVLKENPAYTTRDIAENVGVSPSRVRQIVRLANMDGKIVNFLMKLRGKPTVRGFSENRLRKIVPLNPKEQTEIFRKEYQVDLTD